MFHEVDCLLQQSYGVSLQVAPRQAIIWAICEAIEDAPMDVNDVLFSINKFLKEQGRKEIFRDEIERGLMI